VRISGQWTLGHIDIASKAPKKAFEQFRSRAVESLSYDVDGETHIEDGVDVDSEDEAERPVTRTNTANVSARRSP